VLVDRVLVVVRRLREAGVAVLLVEQLIEKALAIADRVYALARGSIVLEAGTGEADLPRRPEAPYLATPHARPGTRQGGSPMDLGLKDCRAFVAGASKGLGLACARALAHEGARVFVCARDAGELARAAAEIGAAGHSAADVARPDEVTRVVAEAIAALGGLD